jgi:hypothetical protein
MPPGGRERGTSLPTHNFNTRNTENIKKGKSMKCKAEEKENQSEMDFFDWWDSFEAKVVPAQKMPNPMDEKVRKTAGRNSSH